MIALEKVDEQAADWLATLRASADSYSEAERTLPPKEGLRGLVTGKLTVALQAEGRDKETVTEYRHKFLEAAFGIEGGSTKSPSFTEAQAKALAYWLDEGGAEIIEQIVASVVLAEAGAVAAPPAPEKAGDDPAPHWSEEGNSEKKFWAYATGQLGLYRQEVLEALEVAELSATTLSKKEVAKLLEEKSREKQQEKVNQLLRKPLPEALHAEARTVSFTDFYAPSGAKIAITAREGSTAEMVAATAVALVEALEILERMGWKGSPRSNHRNATPPVQSPAPPVSPPAPAAAPISPPAPATSPPATSDDAETVSVSVTSICAQVTPNGNRMYKVKGGRMMKSGVTCWPEVAEPFLAGLGHDITQLAVGTDWNVASLNLVAVCEKPAGNKWPTKVSSFRVA